MTLPASGSIAASQVNTELTKAATANITLNDANVRTLFSVPSGAISLANGYGKSASANSVSATFSGLSVTQNYSPTGGYATYPTNYMWARGAGFGGNIGTSTPNLIYIKGVQVASIQATWVQASSNTLIVWLFGVQPQNFFTSFSITNPTDGTALFYTSAAYFYTSAAYSVWNWYDWPTSAAFTAATFNW
jgi:hypothetical protein